MKDSMRLWAGHGNLRSEIIGSMGIRCFALPTTLGAACMPSDSRNRDRSATTFGCFAQSYLYATVVALQTDAPKLRWTITFQPPCDRRGYQQHENVCHRRERVSVMAGKDNILPESPEFSGPPGYVFRGILCSNVKVLPQNR